MTLVSIGTKLAAMAVGQIGYEISWAISSDWKEKPSMEKPAVETVSASCLRSLGNLFHAWIAAENLASVWALKTLHFGYGTAIPNKCVLNPNAFNTTIFLVGTGAAVLIGCARIAVSALKCEDTSVSYKVVDFLHRALPHVATVANIVTTVALLYLGAPLAGWAGASLVLHSICLIFPVVHKGTDRSLFGYLLNQLPS